MIFRRELLSKLTLLLGGMITAVAAVPVVGAVFSPLLRPSRGTKSEMRAVTALSQLSDGAPRKFEIIAEAVDAWARQDQKRLGAVWLIKHSNTDVRAFTTVCPHLGCGINFNGTDRFSCPCHASAFNLKGEVKAGPAPRGMDALKVRIEKGTVFVRYARFKQGQSRREET